MAAETHLRDGTPRQRALFALLVAVALLGLLLAMIDSLQRIGQPNVGWMLDENFVSPTRREASEAGLRGGGLALRINGWDLPQDFHSHGLPPFVRTEIGATNTLAFRSPGGVERELTLSVEPWTWHHLLFTRGASDAIGLLFAVVGIASFVLRPYEATSWALLAMGCISGGALLTAFIPLAPTFQFSRLYFLVLISLVPSAALHASLAFPVVHERLRRRRTVWAIYALAPALLAIHLAGWAHYPFPLTYARSIGLGATLAAISIFIARSFLLALRTSDPVVAQRARILLAGSVAGLAPFAVVQFARETLGVLPIDSRFTIWPIGLFVLAIGRVTVRQELLNARIAVRRAVLYAGAVAVLTVIALVLIAMRPYAVAMLLFPLLYVWPRFVERLNRRLYPQRTRFPELLRGLGTEMATAESVDDVLDVLAQAPERLCDARSSVAFLLGGVAGPDERVRSPEPIRLAGAPLAAESLVQLMRTTRQEILRDHIALQPQYANIKAECSAGFQRLRAEVLLPMVHEQRVVGGLAVGPRASGDLYEGAELDALSTAAQQAVQAIIRIAATDRLREREREFTDLKRFFPPQIIDQVMARGGAAELRSQRKLVTVVFADLRGFTSFSDSVEPEEVMATLDEYHSVMGQRIAEFSGTLERFAGDGFMVFFNDPLDQPDHAARAARMALAMYADLERLREAWRRKGYRIDVGTGIDTGYATCGFIGYEGRRDYAVIGNVSNLAARLSAAAQAGEILVSARVHGELGDAYRMEAVGELELKGFHQAQMVYRLLGSSEAARRAL